MKENAKISSAAYRVLFMKRMLTKEDQNIDEILNLFSKDIRISRSFAKEVALKYINTLKIIGIAIVRKNNKYSIKNSMVKYDLTLENLKTLAIINAYVNNLHQERIINLYHSVLDKLRKFLSEEQVLLLNKEIVRQNHLKKFNFTYYDEYSDLIKHYEKCCIEDLRVKILYKLPTETEDRTLILEPKSVKYTLNNVYLSGYNPNEGEKQLLLINYVKEIIQLPQKSRHANISTSITFKIKGRLVKAYKLYEGEKIVTINSEETEMVILNNNDDKNALFKRLLRYGDLCEILQPKTERDSFANIIRSTLKNYS